MISKYISTYINLCNINPLHLTLNTSVQYNIQVHRNINKSVERKREKKETRGEKE